MSCNVLTCDSATDHVIVHVLSNNVYILGRTNSKYTCVIFSINY